MDQVTLVGALARAVRKAVPCVGIALGLGICTSSTAQQFITPSTFSAQSNGNFAGSIPIHLPPGTGGLTPSLAITYSSHSPNGLLGLGFSLQGLSSITRCSRTYAQDTVRGSINYDANDRFCLDGQRLVPVSGSYTNYGADGEEYRTEFDSFTQIFSHGSTGNGPTYFTAKTKSGLTETFGNSATSGVVALGVSSIRAWAVSQVMDTASNYYAITYTDDANGAYYPSLISYTGNGSIAPQNFIAFSWAARTDKIYSWTNGSAVTIVNRLTSIQVTAASQPVRLYSFNYDYGAAGGASRLLSVQECAANGGSNPCMPAIPITWNAAGNQSGTFTYSPTFALSGTQSCSLTAGVQVGNFMGKGRGDLLCNLSDGHKLVVASNGDGTFSTPAGEWPPVGGSSWCVAPVAGDYNGDGRTDMACLQTGLVYLALSNGDGTFSGPSVASWPASGTFCSNGTVFAGDFDGDGRTDLLCVTGNTNAVNMEVAFSQGNGAFTTPTLQWPAATTWCTSNWLQLADMDGDGKTDLVCLNKQAGQVTVALSDGDGTFTVKSTFPATGSWCAGGTFSLGDFNGDGKTDVLCTDTNNTQTVALSMGNGNFTNAVVALPSNPSWCTAANLTIGDFNGDGKSDLECNNTSNWLHPIAYSKGDGTFTSPTAGGSAWCEAASLVISADVNGDGQWDLYCVDGGDLWSALSIGGPDLVTKADNGIGASVTATYLPITNTSVYTKDSGSNAAVYPQQDTVGPYYVVSNVVRSNGIGGTLQTNYAYAGLKVDLTGRGSLGFRVVSSTDASTAIVSQTFYNQAFPTVGLPATASTTLAGAGSGGVLKSVVSNYQCINPASGAACAIAVGNRYFPALLNTTTTSFDLNGAPLPTSTTTFAFDNFGNPTNIAASSSDGFGKTTVNTYNNDTVHWWIGQLTESQVTATTP